MVPPRPSIRLQERGRREIKDTSGSSVTKELRGSRPVNRLTHMMLGDAVG